MKVAAIIPAAGAGKRFKSGVPKVFLKLFGKSILARTLESLKKAYPFDETVVVAPKKHLGRAHLLLNPLVLRNLKIVAGGKTRAESVWKGLCAISSNPDLVLVHDAARPLVSRKLVRRLLKEAAEKGGALCGLPAHATVKRIDALGRVRDTEDRETLIFAQTPQVFRTGLLKKRYRALGRKAFAATDEAALFDGGTLKISMIAGEPENIKVTVPEDAALLKFLLQRRGAR